MLRLEIRNMESPIERKPAWIKTVAKMGVRMAIAATSRTAMPNATKMARRMFALISNAATARTMTIVVARSPMAMWPRAVPSVRPRLRAKSRMSARPAASGMSGPSVSRVRPSRSSRKRPLPLKPPRPKSPSLRAVVAVARVVKSLR